MIQSMSYSYAANAVRMKRSSFPGCCFLIVEGEADSKLYSKFVDPARCQIQIAHGWRHVKESIHRLESDTSHPTDFLGVVDADNNLVLARDVRDGSDNLFVLATFRDIEIMMILSSSFDSMMRELGDPARIRSFCGDVSLRDKLLSLVLHLGALRIISERDKPVEVGDERFSLTFDGLEFEEFFARTSLDFDKQRLLSAVEKLTNRGLLDLPRLWSSACEIVDGATLPARVCRGHDVTDLLAVGLQCVLGDCARVNCSREVVESYLRQGFETEDMRNASVYGDIVAWEKQNAPHRVWNRMKFTELV